MALLSDHDVACPELSAATLDAWLAELLGPYPRTAQKAFERLGPQALEMLLLLWERLPEEGRVWALGQPGARRAARGRIREIIGRQEGGALLPVALECCREQPLEARDETLLGPLYRHRDPSVRAAAVAAGSAALDWSRALGDEDVTAVRLAIIARIGRCGQAAEVDLLVRLLEDESWRIRAQAAQALADLAPASLPALASAREQVRIAAAQALCRLGRDAWLEAYLLTSPGIFPARSNGAPSSR